MRPWRVAISAGLVVALLALTASADKPQKRFLMKDGTIVAGVVIDEGETHYLVKTAEGDTVRVPYAEIDDVLHPESATSVQSVGHETQGTVVETGDVAAGSGSDVDLFALREELTDLLSAQEPVTPKELTVFPYGVHVVWPRSRRGRLFCQGGREFIEGPDPEYSVDDFWRCRGGWVPMVSATTHWTEIGAMSLINGAVRDEPGEGAHYCILLNREGCLMVGGEAEASRAKEIIEFLASAGTAE